RGKPGCPVVTPVSAALKGLRAMKARRISVLTPYTPETTRPMAAMFEAEGFELDRVTCLNMTDDRDMARIALDDLGGLAPAAAMKGRRATKARRISVLAPYPPETTRPMAAMFEAEGFELDRVTCLNMTDDRDMARIALDDLVGLAAEAADPASEVLFVSCTAV